MKKHWLNAFLNYRCTQIGLLGDTMCKNNNFYYYYYFIYIVNINASYSGILSVIEFICLSLAYLYENMLKDRTEM